MKVISLLPSSSPSLLPSLILSPTSTSPPRRVLTLYIMNPDQLGHLNGNWRKPKAMNGDSTTSSINNNARAANNPNPNRKAAVGESGKVPSELVGLAYNTFTPEQKKRCLKWRRKNKLCTCCSDKGHWKDKENCSVRAANIKRVSI